MQVTHQPKLIEDSTFFWINVRVHHGSGSDEAGVVLGGVRLRTRARSEGVSQGQEHQGQLEIVYGKLGRSCVCQDLATPLKYTASQPV